MRVLVTGGAGFIGSHVVDQLVAEGFEVVVLDVLLGEAHSNMPDYLNPAATYHFADVTDACAVAAAVEGMDAVSHQAAMVGLESSPADTVAYVRNNDLGTAVLLQALHETSFRGPLVLASSMVVYGDGVYQCASHGRVRALPRTPSDLEAGRFDPLCPRCGDALTPVAVTEGDAVDPRNVYAATKLHQEHLCFSFGRVTGVPVTALRYHNVYGPRMPRSTPYAGVAAIFRSRLQEGAPPLVFEDGRQTRDFIHVSDVARANVTAIVAGKSHGTLNVATGEPHTIGEMAEALSSAFGPGAPAPQVTGDYRLGDVRHVFASPARATGELGFSAMVSFDEGIAAFASEELRGEIDEPVGLPTN